MVVGQELKRTSARLKRTEPKEGCQVYFVETTSPLPEVQHQPQPSQRIHDKDTLIASTRTTHTFLILTIAKRNRLHGAAAYTVASSEPWAYEGHNLESPSV
jgi:hypothetical protein